MQVLERAPAKINLYLRIIGKRPDGFHQLETVMQTLDLADQLILSERQAGITLECDEPRLSNGPDNLAYRAAALLAIHAPKRGVHISLKKRVPWQAGLGGGSSDAAAVLRGLNRLWQLHLPPVELAELAAKLGSDVPFFLAGGLALATGRGEAITALEPCTVHHVALVIPPFGLSTPAVYRAYQSQTGKIAGWPELVRALRGEEYQQIQNLLHNDLEQPAFLLRPDLAEVKQQIVNAGYPVLLSGSGSSLFVLLRSPIGEHLAKLIPPGYRIINTCFAS